MKRIALFAAAVVMVSGITYLSLARDEAKVENNVVENTTTEPGKSVANSGAENAPTALPSSLSSQPSVKADSAPNMGEPATAPEKKSEPVVENKPAATLSDAVKSTGEKTAEHGKSTLNEAAKSTTPSASVPTTPTQAVAKTVGTPVPMPTTPTAPAMK